MWFEAVLSGEDFGTLVGQFTPTTIPIGDGSIHLSDPSEVALIPDVGVRIVCKARLKWPFLGIRVPIVIHSLAVVLRAEILSREDADEIVFKLELEHADFAGIPTLIDKQITEKINKELAEREIELCWKFAETLSHTFTLPSSLEGLSALSLRIARGRVKVTHEAMFFTVAFSTAVRRQAAGDPSSE